MENATKALLMAAGVLIGVMILSLGVALFSELDSYVQTSHEKIEANEQHAFNTQFTNYISDNLTIQDVVTAANLAYENNIDYNMVPGEVASTDPSRMFVAVYLNDSRIDHEISEISAELLTDNLGKEYVCEAEDVVFSTVTGRVYEVYFSNK